MTPHQVATRLIGRALRAGTIRNYNAYLKHWSAFVLRTPTLASDPFFEFSTTNSNVLILASFFDSLIYERHLTHASLKLAWCAVSMHFDHCLKDSSCLRPRMIQRLYQGALSLASEVNPTQHRPSRLPIGLETLHTLRPTINLDSLPPSFIMTELACRLAAHYGARVGEYTFNPSSDDGHTLLARNVTFIIANARISASSLHMHAYDLSTCTHLQVRWATTKIDAKIGDIRRTSPAQIALIEDLFHWSSLSNCIDTDPFFSIRVGEALDILSPSTVNTYLKGTAVSQSLDPTTVSSHSLRHGAATQLTALGCTKATLHQALGWSQRSNSSIHYVHHVPTLDPTGIITFDDLRLYQTPPTLLPAGPAVAPVSTHSTIIPPTPSIVGTTTPSLLYGGGRAYS